MAQTCCEYYYLTRYLLHKSFGTEDSVRRLHGALSTHYQAIAALPTRFANGDVAVMDVDETVLDNSIYQKERESVGLGYSSKSRDDWVKREEATLAPGVAAFINEVVERNGKVALITNRNKQLDSHTWSNRLAQGLPRTTSNTTVAYNECGTWSQADKDGDHCLPALILLP